MVSPRGNTKKINKKQEFNSSLTELKCYTTKDSLNVKESIEGRIGEQ